MAIVRTFKQRGQGMVEYIIILAMVAIAAIGVYSLFGKTVRNQAAGLSKELAGADSANAVKAADTAATGAASVGNQKKDMATYNLQNRQQ